MTDDVLESFRQRVQTYFSDSQDPSEKELLKLCEYGYVDGCIVIKCTTDNMACVIEAHSQAIVAPLAQLDIGVRVVSPQLEYVLKETKRREFDEMRTTAETLSQDQAVDMVWNSPHPAGIARFRDQGMQVMLINKHMPEFVGMSADKIQNAQPAALFLENTEMLNNLIELETTLEKDGAVTGFKLKSRRSNGQVGEYTIDAYYIPDYLGAPARATIYKAFQPLNLI